MVVKPRPKAPTTEVAGGEKSPLVSSGGGIKKRTSASIPVVGLGELALPGELGVFVNAINKAAGPAAPFIIGNQPRHNAGFCRTGILTLDLALGGGWRMSRGSMIYGERSAGKTTVACLTIKQMQKKHPDMWVAYCDIEGTFDLGWAAKLGVDLSRLIIVEPDTGEDAVNQVDGLIRTREISMVVTDSIAMLAPSAEIDGAAEDQQMGLQARLVGKFLRKTNNALIRERKRNHNPLLMHLNQFRMKIGMVFGDPRTLPGGKALEFATTQQVEIKNKEHVASKGDEVGLVMFNQHDIKITKNKSGGPMKEAVFKFIRTPHEGMGEVWIDQAATIAKLGLSSGVLGGSPQSFEHSDFRKWRGAGDYTAWAIENQEDHDTIIEQITAHYMKKWKLA